ncbi:MAG: amino acid permease, partial [Solirubrobacterales bacterium]
MEGSAADVKRDEQRLAELGYRQELSRAWSGFTNFAISFTIISVLAGTFTTFGQAWNNGGPVVISIGWPVICALVLLVALSMAELTSAYPTAGGPYWWANSLGGKTWSWFTGWFNIVGLVGIVASVGYGAATFLNAVLAIYGVDVFGINFADDAHLLSETWLLFFLIMVLYTAVNVYADTLLGLLNNISVGWHVLGVAVVIALLVFVPDNHQDLGFVFGHRINAVGFGDGATGGLSFWFLVLPLGFLLTMYTQTGYDASAHTAEETRGAAIAAANGLWRAVFWSAIIGGFVLLAFLFAATDEAGITEAGGASIAIFDTAL